MHTYPVHGTGLGLRRSFIKEAVDQVHINGIDFMEVAPENWIDVGGRYGHLFNIITEKFPFVCHGLSLNLGGTSPLDTSLINKVKTFLDRYNILCYSEHLSYCADEGHLYDLMPIPFTEAAIKHAAERIKQTQDILDRKIAIENVSYYADPGSQMSESEFINGVLETADCNLLLDLNNIYVNSINHKYNATKFLKSLPSKKIVYAHIAGHYDEAEDLKVDTHGAAVIEPVFDLLKIAYQHFGVFPTLLERDFNIPPLPKLLEEASIITDLQSKSAA